MDAAGVGRWVALALEAVRVAVVALSFALVARFGVEVVDVKAHDGSRAVLVLRETSFAFA